MRSALVFTALLAAFVALPAPAQPLFPDAGTVFDDTILPTVRITLHPDTLAWILDPENAESDVEWRATFVWDDGAAPETVEEVGFRLRGNTSRQAEKKSFKVSFNTYRRGREWNGLDKLNLNSEHNDPTVLRSQIVWGLVREARIPGSRANPVRVIINGDDFGVSGVEGGLDGDDELGNDREHLGAALPQQSSRNAFLPSFRFSCSSC